jgi:hypothetical protein
MGSLFQAALVLALAASPQVEKADATCREPAALAALPGCRVHECTFREYDEAELQSGALDGTGEFPRKLVEGQTSVVTYVCAPGQDLVALARTAEKTVRRAGFTPVYSGGMYYTDLPGFTARKGSEWLQVVSDALHEGPSYTVTAVKAATATPPGATRPARKAGAPPRRTQKN